MSRVSDGHRGPDAVTALTVFLVLTLAIPAQLVLTPLGEAGRPARLFGLVLLGWWILDFLRRPMAEPRYWSAAKVGMICFAFAMGVAYMAAARRPITPIELSGSDRALLAVLSWCGVFLVAADGIRSRGRLYTLLDRISLGVALFATLGIAQFLTGQTLIDWIEIPGFSFQVDGLELQSRSGYSRPAATAIHPIEFGAVLGMGLAVALHLAMDVRASGTIRRWYPAAAIALAIPLSGSRSAFFSGGIVVLLLLPTWETRVRRKAYAVLAGLLATFVVVAPSFLRTIYNLFSGIGTDDSTASRTESYEVAGYFIERYPLFGRGLGTFLPSYRILDNQFLGTTIETGVVGLLSLVLLLAGGVATGQALRRDALDRQTRQLGRSLSAAIAATGLSWLLYDGLGFPINAGVAFMLLGLVAAARQLQMAGPAREPLARSSPHTV